MLFWIRILLKLTGPKKERLIKHEIGEVLLLKKGFNPETESQQEVWLVNGDKNTSSWPRFHQEGRKSRAQLGKCIPRKAPGPHGMPSVSS